VAYAYLRAGAKFTHPFLENESPLEFVAADGSKMAVCSFGLPYRLSRRHFLAKQVEILQATRNERALQRIDFRLDTTGATLTSESVIEPTSDPRRFYADRPFLVLMRRRGMKQPFFMLWVENGELLEAWSDKL
jgi:hypothetical protein